MIRASFTPPSPGMLRINDIRIRHVAEPKLRQCVEYALSRLGEVVDGEFQHDAETYKYIASLSNAQVILSWNSLTGSASLVLDNAPPMMQRTWQELLPELSAEIVRRLNQIVPEILYAQT